MIANQAIMARGLASTTRTLVIMAVTKSTSRVTSLETAYATPAATPRR